tara:strand:+ start:1414 stop:1515 length:102 start_codon:yes stop_codon:yes gene_type:complete
MENILNEERETTTLPVHPKKPATIKTNKIATNY